MALEKPCRSTSLKLANARRFGLAGTRTGKPTAGIPDAVAWRQWAAARCRSRARMELPSSVVTSLYTSGARTSSAWSSRSSSRGRMRIAPGAENSHPLTAGMGRQHELAALPLPDGPPLLASAGADATVRVWATGVSHVAPLTRSSRRVTALASLPLPKRRILLASGGDETVRVSNPVTWQSLTKTSGGGDVLTALPLPNGCTLLAIGRGLRSRRRHRLRRSSRQRTTRSALRPHLRQGGLRPPLRLPRRAPAQPPRRRRRLGEKPLPAGLNPDHNALPLSAPRCR